MVTKTADSRPVNPAVTTSAKPNDNLIAANDRPVVAETKPSPEPSKPIVVQSPPRENPEPVKQAQPETPKDSGPMEVGSLIGYATKRSTPVYPVAARSMRATGVVKVEVTVDEAGDVTEVQKTSGPPLLQTAAKEAVRKWKFKPFTRDGQPVRATGFVSFSFTP